jgi:hypothetical protein
MSVDIRSIAGCVPQTGINYIVDIYINYYQTLNNTTPTSRQNGDVMSGSGQALSAFAGRGACPLNLNE